MRVGADAVQARVEAQVLARGQVAVEQRLVAEEADPPAHGPALARQRAAEHARRAAVRAQQRRQDPQQRRLAGAVGAEHRQRLALLERQRHPGERHALAVGPADVSQLDRLMVRRVPAAACAPRA